VITTDPDKGLLRQIVRDEGLMSLEVPAGVGGRFSALTPVGLFPLAMAGADVRSLMKGAAAVRELTINENPWRNPARLYGLLQYLLYQKGCRINVMMPYSDALYPMADWFRQLWAESLGKRRRLDGTELPVGPTPVKALGVTDQHSQVQLYRDGPDDKVYTFLTVDRFAVGVPIPAVGEAAGLDAVAYLGGHSLEELLAAEERATEAALHLSGRPVTRISFPEVSPRCVGEYFHLMEATTVAAGALFGIDPLDQPGVEAGKQYAYGLMGRQGFSEKRRELEGLSPGDDRFLFTGGEKT
jgi:glucose-6-phosphate isomerase